MGILNFIPYIKNTYKTSYKTTYNITYDNLYIDVNYVMHNVCYYSSDKMDMLNKFKDYVYTIIMETKPKRLFLCADGSAPYAKQVLQRKRRVNKTGLNMHLSAGTYFMCSLENELYGFIMYIKSLNIDVITNIIDEGEGEIKIKYYVIKYQKLYPLDTHMIYSGDSDMILLLFTCDDLSKIYHIIAKDMVIHYGELYKSHSELYGLSKLDFVFINILCGNDYLPKICIIKIENIWNAYKQLIDDYPNGLINSNMVVDSVFMYELITIATKKSPIKKLNTYSYDDVYKPIYKNYVDGLFWCVNMYYNGECTDYKYAYTHTTKPHIYGIMWYIMFNNTYHNNIHKPIPTKLYSIIYYDYNCLSEQQQYIADELNKKYMSYNIDNYDNIINDYNNIIDTLPTEIYTINKMYKPYTQNKRLV